jgi:hypothetical protein
MGEKEAPAQADALNPGAHFMAAKKASFDAQSLRVLEDLFDVTWAIVQARHPFRDLERDPALQDELRRSDPAGLSEAFRW